MRPENVRSPAWPTTSKRWFSLGVAISRVPTWSWDRSSPVPKSRLVCAADSGADAKSSGVMPPGSSAIGARTQCTLVAQRTLGRICVLTWACATTCSTPDCWRHPSMAVRLTKRDTFDRPARALAATAAFHSPNWPTVLVTSSSGSGPGRLVSRIKTPPAALP